VDQIPDRRLNELLDFSSSEEDDEMVQILTEVKERRKQSGYNRQQRFDFMIRFVKDSAPEIARELREIYDGQNNDIYYARREVEYWKSEYDKLKEDL
jgi:hypothetical protein